MKKKTVSPKVFPEAISIQALTQVGPALERIRKLKGWTQEELARQAGVRQATISDIEKNRKMPTMRTFFLILSTLEFDIKLHGRTKSKNPYEGLF